ncbi:hypothetical protein RHODGE_RHODGE_00754 [Rhodoplanes serenus]|uniref:Uncharacterized protein n=1 Tax=Rhodoplanes serenus TaxID=200615 RepID=A0A3S4F7N7_9BRAD|nr:hypothetical protein [Rhodoplanes serenus]VCU07510.1 hypothetical protein RHODGE_RHODGE_00754 [Rhodoplanes serenus]
MADPDTDGTEIPDPEIAEIAREFARHFAPWNLRLPPADVAARQRGKIVQKGWAIWYLFGTDQHGAYLDYYAAHRMTNDSHVRLRAGGRHEGLPSIASGMVLTDDPEEDARREAAFFRHNREVADLLAAKGFRPEGDEPGGVLINRYLQLGGRAEPGS